MLTRTAQGQNKYFFKVAICLAFPVVIFAASLSAQHAWTKELIPDHAKLQFAGGIGYLSVGAGYNLLKEKLGVDFLYGYVPASIGGLDIHSVTTKLTWTPLKTINRKNLFVKPLNTGFLVNYTFGRQYFAFDPPNYSYKFYGFPTALRSAILIGSEAGINTNNKKIKQLSFFYEFNVFDQELSLLVTNPRTIEVLEILTLSVGVKLGFQKTKVAKQPVYVAEE